MNKGKHKNVDLVAFEAIYDKHWQSLYISAFKILKNKVQASQVVQEIFVDLLNNRKLLKREDLDQYLDNELRYRVLEAISKGGGYESLLDSLTQYISAESSKTADKKSGDLNVLNFSFSGESV
ncbi:RNA polymerase sigma factor [Pedobacter sp. GR22-6]|uniref:RNA polymerase sigma factor n=1 Tax=Pedobacter sp. GR22-6 TaxID=3127957 RepID=UPI00307E94EF